MSCAVDIKSFQLLATILYSGHERNGVSGRCQDLILILNLSREFKQNCKSPMTCGN